jgi:hypothetical protein
MSRYLRLFGHAFFTNLGLGGGSGLLAGVSFALTAVFFVSNHPLFILLRLLIVCPFSSSINSDMF